MSANVTNVRPFLMFQNSNAEEAMSFYASVIPGSTVGNIVRWDAAGPGAEGTVKLGTFSIGDQSVMCSDSPVKHAFGFTPSFSFFVECKSEEELVRLAAALSEGGSTLMPLGSYGFSRKFGWFNDRFGVSWQLNLA